VNLSSFLGGRPSTTRIGTPAHISSSIGVLSPLENRYVAELCEVLNESETTFPGTNLRLIYDLISNQIKITQFPGSEFVKIWVTVHGLFPLLPGQVLRHSFRGYQNHREEIVLLFPMSGCSLEVLDITAVRLTFYKSR